MAFSTITRFVLLALFSVSVSAEPDSDYPAPPGVYGQEEILKNSKLNFGKGAPYVMINNAKDAKVTATSPKSHQIPAKPEIQSADQLNHLPLIFTQPEPAQQQTIQLPQNPETTAPQEKTVPKQQNVMPRNQQFTQAIPPAPHEYNPPGNYYPSARQLDEQFQKARNLPFDQWGQEPAQKPAKPIDFQAAPDMSQYDYPRPNRFYQGTGRSNFMSSYPPLTSSQSKPAFMRQPYQRAPKNTYPGDYDSYTDSMYGRNWMNDALIQESWMDVPLTAPSNMDLQHFEQFPVPQDIYGNAPIISQPSGSGRYFRKIPEEEIIYPPNYPGFR